MKINIRKQAYTLALASCLTLASLGIGDAIISSNDESDIEISTTVYADALTIDEVNEGSNEIDTNLSMVVPGVRVTTDCVNIRSEANTDCSIKSVANTDDVFKMICKYNDEWYQIKYNNDIAYINANYVSETNTIDGDILDVRYMNDTGAFYDLDGNYLKDLEKYECVEVYGEKDDKYFVSINGNIGYVSKDLTSDLTDKCAVVDISSQRLSLYNRNEKILTTAVVTGKDSTPSDIGLFDVDTMLRDTNLTDYATYDVPVDFWIDYNEGEGIHDSYWREIYGGTVFHYDGSHGCINTPYDAVCIVYDTLDIGDHVLVKK